ncbi:MAG TPA: LysM peptidoglycan-binding domain-containing protein, partial [Polyangiales bacterium]|nr:LysM peptidoglycan-binding domain-containing protein [Polyangiales bacterium]
MPSDLRIVRVGAVRAALVLALAGGVLAPGAVSAEQKHVVRLGQSLGVIAKQYGTTVASLAAVNSIHPDGILREGQVLKVPGSGSIEVSAGQSLSKIARDYHVSVPALAAANGLAREA